MIMDRVCEQLNLVDTDEAVDVNNITLRISMDVTGIVGFAKDFRTTCSFHDEKTNATIENLKSGRSCDLHTAGLLTACMHERQDMLHHTSTCWTQVQDMSSATPAASSCV